MKHAGPDALSALSTLLADLRRIEELREKRPGVFYRRSRAFLHFHEDPEGLFADVRLGDEFERLPVTRRRDQQALVRAIRKVL